MAQGLRKLKMCLPRRWRPGGILETKGGPWDTTKKLFLSELLDKCILPPIVNSVRPIPEKIPPVRVTSCFGVLVGHAVAPDTTVTFHPPHFDLESQSGLHE